MENKEFISTIELAKILGVSRVTVFNKIKKGEIKAVKVGRNFIINRKDLDNILDTHVLNTDEKEQIKKAVKKVVSEYGETLKLLGDK